MTEVQLSGFAPDEWSLALEAIQRYSALFPSAPVGIGGAAMIPNLGPAPGLRCYVYRPRKTAWLVRKVKERK